MSIIDMIILGVVTICVAAFCLTLSVLVIYYGYRLVRHWMKRPDEELF